MNQGSTVHWHEAACTRTAARASSSGIRLSGYSTRVECVPSQSARRQHLLLSETLCPRVPAPSRCGWASLRDPQRFCSPVLVCLGRHVRGQSYFHDPFPTGLVLEGTSAGVQCGVTVLARGTGARVSAGPRLVDPRRAVGQASAPGFTKDVQHLSLLLRGAARFHFSKIQRNVNC